MVALITGRRGRASPSEDFTGDPGDPSPPKWSPEGSREALLASQGPLGGSREALLASRGPLGGRGSPREKAGCCVGRLFDDLGLLLDPNIDPKSSKLKSCCHSHFRRLFLSVLITFGDPKGSRNQSKVVPSRPLEKNQRFPDFVHHSIVLEGFWKSRGTKK